MNPFHLPFRFRGSVLALLGILPPSLPASAQITFTRVADATASPPGSTVPFLGFTPPKVERGWVVFEGWVVGPGGFGYGLYGWRQGVLTTLVDAQTPHPELAEPFRNNFGGSGEDSFALGDGVLVFAHQQRLDVAGIFEWSDGVISTRVWTNDVFGTVGRYTGGAVVGRSQGTNLVATRFGNPWSGLVAVPGDGSALVHNFSDDLPGLPANFKSLGPAAFQGGRLVFSAAAPSGSALYCRTGGVFRLLADTRMPAPGRAAAFSGFGRVALDGHTAVFAATAADSSAGLYRVNLDGTGLVRLVDTSTALPGGSLLIAPPLENWSLGAGDGDVVFEAGDPFGDLGIYLWRAGAVSRIVGNQGETLEGRRVLETDLGPGCLSDGIVGFTAQTTGGRGVYLAHLPRGPVDPLAGEFAQTLAPDALAAPLSLLAWLERTEEGRRLIRLYFQHAGELLRLALADPALREGTLATLHAFLPGLIGFLQGNGSETPITADQVALLNGVWEDYLEAASPALAADLTAERARFHGFADFVGHTFADWGMLLAIGVPDEPHVILSRPRRENGTFRAEANPVPGAAYHLERSTGELPVQWAEVPGAEIRALETRVEVLDAGAVSDRSLYRLRLEEIP